MTPLSWAEWTVVLYLSFPVRDLTIKVLNCGLPFIFMFVNCKNRFFCILLENSFIIIFGRKRDLYNWRYAVVQMRISIVKIGATCSKCVVLGYKKV